MKIKLIGQKLYSGSFITLVSLGIGNFLNLLFLLTMSRHLTPTQFGTTQAILAFNYFLAILITALSFSYIYHFHQLKNKQVPSAIKLLERVTIKWLTVIFSLSLFTILTVKPLLPSLNHITFLLFILQALLTFVSIIYTSILQAKLHFIYFGIVIITSALVKTLSLTLFFQLNLSHQAPYLSLIFYFVTSILVSKLITLKLYPPTPTPPPAFTKSKFWRYSSLSLITSLYITILSASDLILARIFLATPTAGVFAAIASTGKIIYFTSAAITTALFPLTVGVSLNRAKSLFWRAFSLTLILCVILATLFILTKDLLPQIFHHPSYLLITNHLPSYLFAIILSTLSILCLQFLLALKQRSIYTFGTLSIISYLIPLLLYHQDIHQIISSLIIGSLLAFTITFITVLFTFRQHKR